jgi:DNA-binding transcriptional LysR family regulator
MSNVSLELYRTFWAVGMTGNMTRAAEMLYVTQPNISLALKALERQLGSTLCIRSQKGVVLTAEGQVLFKELDAAFEHIEAAERKINSLAHLDSGVVSISASDTICNYFLLPYISSFTADHPNIRLEITNRTSFETVELVKSGKVNIGFVNLPIEDDDLSFSVCASISDILVAGSKFAYLTEKPMPLQECAKYPLIMLERKSNSRLFLDMFLIENSITPEPIMELGSIDLIISFVRNNLGIAFIPYELCGQFVDNKTLFQIPLAQQMPDRTLALAALKNMPMPHAAHSFKEFVMNNV